MRFQLPKPPILPPAILCMLLALVPACQTTEQTPKSTYYQDIQRLENHLSNDHITKAEYIRELIQLDAKKGEESSKQWNALMLKNPHAEGIHDPLRHGLHFNLIEKAKEAGEITEIEYKELRKMAKEARQARSMRNNTRMMERFKLGYH
jgi:hypothetical protein